MSTVLPVWGRSRWRSNRIDASNLLKTEDRPLAETVLTNYFTGGATRLYGAFQLAMPPMARQYVACSRQNQYRSSGSG